MGSNQDSWRSRKETKVRGEEQGLPFLAYQNKAGWVTSVNTSREGGVSKNEALGRKKNHLIESTKYKSAVRNARKLEIRKKSLSSKQWDPETAANEGGLGHKKPTWGSSGTWQIEERITSCYGFRLFFQSSCPELWDMDFILGFALDSGKSPSLFCRLPFNIITFVDKAFLYLL